MANYVCPPQEMISKFYKPQNLNYIQITGYECKAQFAFPRGATASGMRGAGIGSWKFLISQDISETVNHTWAKYESMTGKLQDLIDDGMKTATSTMSIIGSAGKSTASGSSETNGGWETAFKKTIASGATFSGAIGEKVKSTKIDSSLVYQDSTNRQFAFDVQLLSWKNPKLEVWEPLQKLMYYSCADATDNGIGISFPGIFEVKVVSNKATSNIAHYKNCALVGVQPTWEAPWIKGYPRSARATLTFYEIAPLYRKTILGKDLISTSTKSTKKK